MFRKLVLPSIMKLKFYIPFSLVMISLTIKGQDNPCECCARTFLSQNQEYDELFSPKSIKEKGINEYTFYTTRNRLAKGQIDTLKNNYKEIQFLFDNDGYVIEIITHNRMGIPHLKYTIKRNKKTKRMVKKSFQYVDGIIKSNLSLLQELDYSYNDEGLLKQIKGRGNGGEVLPDSLSYYIKYQYDNRSRPISIQGLFIKIIDRPKTISFVKPNTTY